MTAASVMLDTNVLIRLRKERTRGRAVATFERRLDGACTSVVTIGELRFSADKSRSPIGAHAAIDSLIRSIDVLPLDDRAAVAYGRIRSDLQRRGEIIGNNDLWIAAHALSLGLTLVTGNIREFQRVSGLRVEDWVV